MKRAKSPLLETFISHVDKGLISPRAHSSGGVVLEKLTEALREILRGTDPDAALGIQRAAGAPPEWHTIALALLIHQHRAAGEKWAVVEHLANEWLAAQGLEAVTLPRLQAIYRRHRRGLQDRDHAAELMRLIQAALNRAEKK